MVFAGGGGQSYVVSMQATVIRSDGGIETEIAQSPGIGTTLMFTGTTRDDRAIVNVTYTDGMTYTCLLYTSDAADDLLCVDLGGRRIIKKKTKKLNTTRIVTQQRLENLKRNNLTTQAR